MEMSGNDIDRCGSAEMRASQVGETTKEGLFQENPAYFFLIVEERLDYLLFSALGRSSPAR